MPGMRWRAIRLQKYFRKRLLKVPDGNRIASTKLLSAASKRETAHWSATSKACGSLVGPNRLRGHIVRAQGNMRDVLQNSLLPLR
jgi:hypothetical protein